MRKYHLVIAGLAFLMCLFSMYFGIRIFNANENHLLTELNQIDKIYHDDINQVPFLSFKAGVFTAPLLLAMLVFQIITLIKTQQRQAKNVCRGLLAAISIILIFDALVMIHPLHFDFSKWGFVWICLGLIILAGNLLAYVLRRKEA